MRPYTGSRFKEGGSSVLSSNDVWGGLGGDDRMTVGEIQGDSPYILKTCNGERRVYSILG